MSVQIKLPNQHSIPGKGSRDRPLRGKYKRMVRTQNALVNRHVHERSNGGNAHVSKTTQHHRRVIINAQLRSLHELGYPIEDVYHFKRKHEEALKKHWLEKEHPPKTMRLYVSVMHQFARWIDKPWLFEDAEAYLPDPSYVSRTYVADPDRFQTVASADFTVLLVEACEIDNRVACILSLCLYWGLRVEEALKFHPHTARHGDMVDIFYGTKGGRPRVLHEPLSSVQQEVISWAQSLVPTPAESMIPSVFNYKQYKNRFYAACRKLGLTRKGKWGFTPHALRQMKLVEVYQATAGGLPPVAGGTADDVTRERDLAARQVVAEYAGHSRREIASAYIGAVVTLPTKLPRGVGRSSTE